MKFFIYNCLLLSIYYKLKVNILVNGKLIYEIISKYSLSLNEKIKDFILLFI